MFPPFDDQYGPVQRVHRLATVSFAANTRASDMQMASHPRFCSALGEKDTHHPTSRLVPWGNGLVSGMNLDVGTRNDNWRNSRTICQATLFQTLALVTHEHCANGHKPRSLRSRVTSNPSTPRFLLPSDCRLYPANLSNRHQDDFPTPL